MPSWSRTAGDRPRWNAVVGALDKYYFMNKIKMTYAARASLIRRREAFAGFSAAVSLAGLFENAVHRHADRDFIHVPSTVKLGYAPTPITLTYRQAASRIEVLRHAYEEAGYTRGVRVGLALDNRPEFFLHLIALNGLGASVVPLNSGMSFAELNYVLIHSDAQLVVALEEHAGHLAEAVPNGCNLAIAGDALTRASHPSRQAAAAEVALLYTSGTTGTPKGCILDETYFHDVGAHYLGIGGYCAFREGQDRLITPLPVTHMNALAVSFMAMTLTGGCLIQLDRFHPSTWWESVRSSRATCFHYLGVMPALLLAAAPHPQDDLRGRVRFGFGAGVDPRHHAAFEARFGVPLIEAWAMTETGGGAWITASCEPRHVGQRCFGRAPAGLAWRLVNEAGDEAASGEPGELLVRRAEGDPRKGFFSGYYKDAAATEAAWADGWFHTGDIVRVDPAGSFFFVDRSKNIIRRSGENIAAVEVESIVQQVPGVAGCAVTAVPDEIRGEEVFAYVVVPPGGAHDRAFAERIQATCLSALAYFKAPGYLEFIEQLPQTASNKLARATIKKRAGESASSGTAFDLRAGKRRPENMNASR